MLSMSFSKKLSDETQNLINQMPGYFLWKDLKSVYLAGCIKTAKLFGFNKTDELIGITDYDLRCKAADYADIFLMQDAKAIESSNPVVCIDIHPYLNNEVKPLIINKCLIRDKINNPVAIGCFCLEVNSLMLNEIIRSLSALDKKAGISPLNNNMIGSYFLNKNYPGISLSKRQSQCLFYLIRGKSIPSIARILTLSPRTIESYLEEIKFKMNCNSKSEIIEKAIERNYANIIPEGVLTSREI